MGQPPGGSAAALIIGIATALGGAFFVGCEKKPASPATRPASVSPTITVASLVPAATDLITGMGAEAHLVAVSNYDPITGGARDLPRVGDYQNTDWEAVAGLRPTVMIIQMDPARLPQGFIQRADRLGVRLVNVRINDLNDVFTTARQLGHEIGEPAKGDVLADALKGRIDAVRRRCAALPPVRTLLTLDEDGSTLVGPGTFLDDMLTAAGGQNAAAPLNAPYPRADPETLLTLKPDAVIVLRPAGKPEVLERAKAFWAKLPGVPAGAQGRVYLLNDSKVLLPGSRVADLTEAMAQMLHHVEPTMNEKK